MCQIQAYSLVLWVIDKLLPFGYGKEVLRGKNKIYLSDPAIAPAVLMKGKTVIENPIALSQCVETSVISHLWTHCRANQGRFSYWRSPKERKEIDLVIELDGKMVPIEIKYQADVQAKHVPGLIELINTKGSNIQGYIATKAPSDLGPIKIGPHEEKVILKIPASLLCFYLGQAEFHQRNLLLEE